MPKVGDRARARQRSSLHSLLVPLLMAITLNACGGGGGDEEGPAPAPQKPDETGPAVIEGVWTGVATKASDGSNHAAVIIAAEDGDTILQVLNGADSIVVRGDGCCDSRIDGSADGWSLINQQKVSAPVDLQVTGTGNSQILQGSVTVEGVRYQLRLERAPDYSSGLDLGTLAGTYGSTSTTGSWRNVTLSSTGAITGADSQSCTFGGQARIPKGDRNLFEITSFTMSGCAGGASVRNGTYTGLGYLSGKASATAEKTFAFIVTGPVVYPNAIPGYPVYDASLSLRVDSEDVEYGGTTTIKWAAQKLDTCSASGDWAGARATTGNESTGALTASKSYTLTCSSGSIARSATVTVEVPPLPPDPGAENDATVAGIDSNANGIRDDEERRILTSRPPGAVRTLLMERAEVLGKTVVPNPTRAQAEERFRELFENLECLYVRDAANARTLALSNTAQFMNTPARAKAYIDFSQAAGGAVVEARIPEHLTYTCPTS